MKSDVTLNDIELLLEARLFLLRTRRMLWAVRSSTDDTATIRFWEQSFGMALDQLWKAQQRAA